MRALEFVLVITLVIVFIVLLSKLSITPRPYLKNEYFILKLEAYSIANVLLRSNIFAYTNDPIKYKALILSLIPEGKEYMLRVTDMTTNDEIIVVKSDRFNEVKTSVTIIIFYSNSLNNRIYMIEFSLGE